MLKIKKETETVYIPLHTIKEIRMTADKAVIETQNGVHTTEEVEYVKNCLSNVMGKRTEIDRLTNAIRDLWNLLRARLR